MEIPAYHPTALPAQLTACHECDLLNTVPELAPGHTARCHRCNSVLYKNPKTGIETPLAMGIASLFLFIVANLFPFLSFSKSGLQTQTYLMSAVFDLASEDMNFLAAVVFFTCILAPAIMIGTLLVVLIPLYIGRLPPALPLLSRLLAWIQPWAMLDVFMIGILVAIVKLIKMAHIGPGVSFWAFVGLTITIVGALTLLENRVVWHRYQELQP
jgi:paraquat-inducible protein A